MITKKGILKNFYSGTYTATIQLSGSAKAYLEGVPVARNIPPAEMVSGRRIIALFPDKANPAEAVVIAVYQG